MPIVLPKRFTLEEIAEALGERAVESLTVSALRKRAGRIVQVDTDQLTQAEQLLTGSLTPTGRNFALLGRLTVKRILESKLYAASMRKYVQQLQRLVEKPVRKPKRKRGS